MALLKRWLLHRGVSVRSVSWRFPDKMYTSDDPRTHNGYVQAMCGLLQSLPALQSFRIYPSRDDDVTLDSDVPALCGALQQCSFLTRLRLSVDLNDGDAVEVGQRSSATLGQLTHLRSLNLRFVCHGNLDRYEDEGVELDHLNASLGAGRKFRAFLGALAFQELTQLCLDAHHLVGQSVDGPVIFPAAVTRLRKLKDLTLRSFDNVTFERGWAHLPALRKLALQTCELDPHDLFSALKALVALRHFECIGGGSVSLPAGLCGLTALNL